MIKLIKEHLKANVIYSGFVILLLVLFTFFGVIGSDYFTGGNVQKNAGYNGPIPHSGYGVRFYHK
jgi:hypothetical protein